MKQPPKVDLWEKRAIFFCLFKKKKKNGGGTAESTRPGESSYSDERKLSDSSVESKSQRGQTAAFQTTAANTWTLHLRPLVHFKRRYSSRVQGKCSFIALGGPNGPSQSRSQSTTIRLNFFQTRNVMQVPPVGLVVL